MCVQRITAEIVLWTAGFVLCTLVINAPLLPFFLRVSGLSKGGAPPQTLFIAVHPCCPLPCSPLLPVRMRLIL